MTISGTDTARDKESGLILVFSFGKVIASSWSDSTDNVSFISAAGERVRDLVSSQSSLMFRVAGELKTSLVVMRESSEIVLEYGDRQANHPCVEVSTGDELILLGGSEDTVNI